MRTQSRSALGYPGTRPKPEEDRLTDEKSMTFHLRIDREMAWSALKSPQTRCDDRESNQAILELILKGYHEIVFVRVKGMQGKPK